MKSLHDQVKELERAMWIERIWYPVPNRIAIHTTPIPCRDNEQEILLGPYVITIDMTVPVLYHDYHCVLIKNMNNPFTHATGSRLICHHPHIFENFCYYGDPLFTCWGSYSTVETVEQFRKSGNLLGLVQVTKQFLDNAGDNCIRYRFKTKPKTAV